MKALDRNKLGELITKLRKSRDLSLDGMGELLHVSGRTVRRWEKGDILPTMEDVINICNEFNLSLEEIYEGEISIDREVGRKLSRVDSNIEAIGLKMTTTEESVKSISDGLIEIKNQITKSDDQEDLTWLVLLAMHLFFTGAAFLCYVMWRLDVKWTLYLSIIYIVRLSQLIIMNRNNMKSQKLFFLYSLLLLLNMLINYVLFADITVGVINNI